MPRSKKTYLYKSLSVDMVQHGHRFEVGKWYKEDKITLCERGFHASEMALDAMGYVPCEVLAKVDVRGACQKDDDKQVWSEMKIVKTYQWTKDDSAALAIYAAELVLPLFEKVYPNDARPRKAIECAKQYPNITIDAATYAVYAANAAAKVADADYAVSYAVSYAAKAAVYVVEAASYAANAATYAVYAASYAANAAKAAVYVVEAAAYAAGKKTKKKIERWIHQRIGF